MLKNAVKEMRKVSSLAGAAMLSALKVVLNLFTIPVSNMLEIGFSYLATALSGYLYGPMLAGLMGIAADLLGYFTRPNGGFFPGFTFNEFLLGFIYGCFFFGQKLSLKRVIFAQLTVVLLINVCFTPLWLYMMYGNSFFALLGVRIIKNLIKLPIDVTLLYFMLKIAQKHRPLARRR